MPKFSFLIKERFYRLIIRVNQPWSGLVHRSVTIHRRLQFMENQVYAKSKTGVLVALEIVMCWSEIRTVTIATKQKRTKKKRFSPRKGICHFSPILHSLLKLDIFLDRSFQDPVSTTTDSVFILIPKKSRSDQIVSCCTNYLLSNGTPLACPV